MFMQPPVVRTKMNEVEVYNIHITEFDILSGVWQETKMNHTTYMTFCQDHYKSLTNMNGGEAYYIQNVEFDVLSGYQTVCHVCSMVPFH